MTAGIFDVLGITPIAGRTFSDEDEAKRANVVVLSEAFWRTRYNADPGILAYSVQQHVRDFGVRRALGATTNDILRLVLANAARVIATGAAIGLVLSIVCGRLIETMLFGVRPLDPATFAFVTIVVGITAAMSVAGPAWRAVRIDPAVALRNI